jgi:RES domain-containing protein
VRASRFDAEAYEVAAVAVWTASAVPLAGLYFRSVEFRHMDPKDVVSGAGTQTYGGRFASVGTKAVYLSITDSGASKEVTARKANSAERPKLRSRNTLVSSTQFRSS